MNDPTVPSEPHAFARPAAFSDEPFEAALARATAERRWLLVDLVDAANPVSWAAVFTTWRDADVVSWPEAYAVAIQVDVRADTETVRILGVDAASAPTVILFREGRERLRIPGRQSPTELLKQLVWIDVAEDNLTLARRMLKDPERDMSDRDGLADALLRAGLLEEALGHYDWLWQHMAEVDPEMAGVRVRGQPRDASRPAMKPVLGLGTRANSCQPNPSRQASPGNFPRASCCQPVVSRDGPGWISKVRDGPPPGVVLPPTPRSALQVRVTVDGQAKRR